MVAAFDKNKVIEILNSILETELAGVVRYTHYSFMIFGHARIPIISWMRGQATESREHAETAGEHNTARGGVTRSRAGWRDGEGLGAGRRHGVPGAGPAQYPDRFDVGLESLRSLAGELGLYTA